MSAHISRYHMLQEDHSFDGSDCSGLGQVGSVNEPSFTLSVGGRPDNSWLHTLLFLILDFNVVRSPGAVAFLNFRLLLSVSNKQTLVA